MPNQTGPTTPAGQAVSCLNGLLHGAASRKLFIPGENPDDFFALLESCFEDFKPGSLNTAALVSDIAIARWHIWRRQRSSAANENLLHTAKPDESQWTNDDLHRLNLFDRYQTQAHRAFHRAVKDLQAIQKQAASEQRWRDHFALQKQRFDLEAERFKLAQERAKPKPTASTTREPEYPMSEAEVIRRVEAFDKQSAVELPVETLNGQRVVRQTILVGNIDGNVVATFRPSNPELGEFCLNSEIEYERAQRTGDPSVLPPPDVCRLFEFTGPVPAEYHWLLPDEADPSLPNIKVIALLPLNDWWDTYEAEGKNPTKAHCHNGPLPQEAKKAA